MVSPQMTQEVVRIRKVLEAINVNLTAIARAMQSPKTPEEILRENKAELERYSQEKHGS